MSSKAADPARLRAGRPDAGFMLLEVLVAVVIAGLVLSAVAAALAQGWRTTRVPLDVLSAVTLARIDLQRGPDGTAAAAPPPGFAVSRRAGPVDIEPRPSPVAPAPQASSSAAGSTHRGPQANDVMPGVTHHAEGAASGRLETLTVTVQTPSGRRVSIETVRLDARPN